MQEHFIFRIGAKTRVSSRFFHCSYMESARTDMVRVSQDLLPNMTSYPCRPRFYGLCCFLFDAKQN